MSSTFIPREQRVQVWGMLAYERARSGGAKAIDAGVAAINAAFGENHRANDRKLTVERSIRRGAGAVRTRCDYGFIAFMCPSSIDGAAREIERDYRAEVKDRKTRQREGFRLKNPDRENRLWQARLFVRWYRRYADQQRYPLPAIIGALTTSPYHAVEVFQAAE